MTKKYFIIISILITSLLHLSTDLPNSNESHLLGYWNLKKGNSIDGFIFKRAIEFKENRKGFHFKTNGLLVYNRNSQNCGMKPFRFKKFNGDWQLLNDNQLRINYAMYKDSIQEIYSFYFLKENSFQINLVESKILD